MPRPTNYKQTCVVYSPPKASPCKTPSDIPLDITDDTVLNVTMTAERHHYLCSFCNNMFEAPVGIDRTREIRCTACVRATPDPYDEAGLNLRLRTITT